MNKTCLKLRRTILVVRVRNLISAITKVIWKKAMEMEASTMTQFETTESMTLPVSN